MLPSQPNEILDPIVLPVSLLLREFDKMTLSGHQLCQGARGCKAALAVENTCGKICCQALWTVKTLWTHASDCQCSFLAFHYPWNIRHKSFLFHRLGLYIWASEHSDILLGLHYFLTYHAHGRLNGMAGTYQRQIEWNIFEKKQNHLYPRIQLRPNLALDLFISLFFAVSVECDVGAWSNTNTLLRGANKINWVGHIPQNTYTRHRTIMIVSKNGFVWEWLTH